MTRFIETNDKINHDDPSNITAKNAITENMNKECESNIICQATAFLSYSVSVGSDRLASNIPVSTCHFDTIRVS
jgi:hypothetical protein